MSFSKLPEADVSGELLMCKKKGGGWRGIADVEKKPRQLANVDRIGGKIASTSEARAAVVFSPLLQIRVKKEG